MIREFDFGKIDYYNTGRKSWPVVVTMALEETANGPELSVCGEVWNTKRTGIASCGQILDSIKECLNNETFNEIYRLWKLYHLNGMNAGSPKQMEAIKAWQAAGNRYDYTNACEYLNSIDLLVDKSYKYDYPEGSRYEELDGYKYGTAWIYKEIPEDDLNKIKALIMG